MSVNNPDFESSPAFRQKSDFEITKDYQIQEKQIDIDSGFVGKFFGNKENAPSNIAGLVILSSFIAGLLASLLNPQTYAKDFWLILTPLITLSFGYLFGHKK